MGLGIREPKAITAPSVPGTLAMFERPAYGNESFKHAAGQNSDVILVL